MRPQHSSRHAAGRGDSGHAGRLGHAKKCSALAPSALHTCAAEAFCLLLTWNCRTEG